MSILGAVLEQTLADKVLVHCELVKTGVTNILDAYNKALDNKSKGIALYCIALYCIIIVLVLADSSVSFVNYIS